MPTLTLEPDEVLPNTPAPLEGEAEGPFAIVWRGKERQFLLRAVEIRAKKPVVFACALGNEAAGNWLLYERETLKPVTWWLKAPRLEVVASEFATRDRALGRLFIKPGVNYKQSVRILLGEEGIGGWLDKNFRFTSRFNFDIPLDVFESERAQVENFWKRESANPDSDMSFAARWPSLNFLEQQSFVWGEHYAEIEQVMKWVLQREIQLWERGSPWNYRVGPLNSDFGYLFCYNANIYEDFSVQLPFIHAMNRFLVEEHCPRVSKSLRDEHPCLRDWLDRDPEWFRVYSETPTAHEQFEAALNLRDWLRKHDAPAELLALLRL